MPEKLGKYSLLKLLATGGMAEIWLARQREVEGFEKLVVVKRILPHLSSNADFVRMFLDEARLAAQLSHPNIVQIYELGRVDELYFIAMEFIHGENLRVVNRAATRAGTGFHHDLCAKVISQSCEALYYAHNKTDVAGRPLGLVHRDISPQNIILSFEGQTKVVDFGIAKAATQCEETRTGVLKGKYAYMSPEQCRGDKLDGRSDIFALGIVLWELATGTRLFKQASELMILKAICDEPTPAPTQVRRDIPAELEAIILKALAKHPEERFQDCYQMHLALEGYLRSREHQVTSLTLAEAMRGLFSEKLAGWQKVIEGLEEEDDEDLESALFSDLSDLIEGRTPASQITRSPMHDSSGSKPLIVLAEEAPPPRPAQEAPRAPEKPSPEPARRSRFSASTLVLGALLLAVAGAWAWQSLGPGFGKPADSENDEPPPVEATGTIALSSTPSGAEVFINGNSRGHTPLTLAGMPVEETLRVRVQAEGYDPWLTEILLDRPGTTRRLSARLERGVNAPPAVLEIRTEPAGARVLVDGAAVPGLTPVTLEVGPARTGKEVRIEKSGFEAETRTLDLEPGSRGRWDLSLRKEPEPETERPVRPRPITQRPRRPQPTKTQPETEKVAGTGLLSVNASPWCDVTLDGRELGQTPILGVEVPAGRRRIVCTNPQLGANRSITVNVPAGGHARETIRFSMGRLDVRVNPWAEVKVNGRSLGTTPFRPAPLPEGAYTVVLENPGFGFRKEYQVTIEADQTHTIRENLLE
ncbi:MAG: PEGA domain-containing protein [Myxococcota bacterium]